MKTTSENERNVNVRRGLTVPERFASSTRMASDALDRLTVGPLSAVAAGVGVVFGLGLAEGYVHLRPVIASNTAVPLPGRADYASTTTSRLYFAVRYSLSQLLPSVIWYTQPSEVVCEYIGFERSRIWKFAELPPRRNLLAGNLIALRGAVAGSILLSQVLSITTVLQEARKAYSDKIYAGEEPPLECTYNNKWSRENGDGVVIRLAGRESDVTEYGMASMGRQRLWPIFEDPQHQTVRSMVQKHATETSITGPRTMGIYNLTWGGSHTSARVPVYWSIANGRYSDPECWRGMGRIPSSWLFKVHNDEDEKKKSHEPQHVKNGPRRQMLIIEADATAGDGSLLSLSRDSSIDLDLDLRELNHAFRMLARLANADRDSNIATLQVILVDPEYPVESGGGRVSTAAKEIQVLMGADCIVIDSRAAIVHTLTSWLDNVYTDKRNQTCQDNMTDRETSRLRPVVLETHSRKWFTSIKAELRKHGYNVVDRSAVPNTNNGLGPINLPVLVYERTSADTVDTIRGLVDMGTIQADRTCALLSDHHGLEAVSEVGLPQGASYICSSEIYAGAFQFVRDLAVKGKGLNEIQARIDAGEAWELRRYRMKNE